MQKVGFFGKLERSIQAFKGVNYAQLNDGTHGFNYESQAIDRILQSLGIGTAYYSPTENLKEYYSRVFFLQDCINLYADTSTQIIIQEVDERGNVVENSPFVQMLENPNPFQDRNELIKEMIVNYFTSGGVFQYSSFFERGNLTSFVPNNLYNLDFFKLKMPKIKNKYEITEKDLPKLILKEQLEGNKDRTLKMSEISYFYDNISRGGCDAKGYNSDFFFNPISRLHALHSSLQTLIDSQETMAYLSGKNVNKIISKKQNAGAVAPLDGQEKNDIERKLGGFGKYGAKNGKAGDIVATNEEFGILDLTRDNRKMQILEMQENAKDNVRNALLIPQDYFGDSTYENKQFSEARFTLNQVKPITDSWLNSLVNKTPKYFKERRTRLVGRYDHVPAVLETQTKLKNVGFLDRSNAMKGVISAYKEMQTVEPYIKWDDFLLRHQFTDFLKVE